ncbi:SHOCT domain-containing protein [uncultured Arthrobacter sp.]|uniref:SHOCT domain-containing protein n=1 Tax=uncultured Arthrobacter sp. TaxID=114050 RepID=UPI003217C209
MMYGGYGDWGVVGWIVMALMMLLFWAGVVTVVILLVRGGGQWRGASYGSPHDEAERILNERFARGEIDATELNERRAALRRKP